MNVKKNSKNDIWQKIKTGDEAAFKIKITPKKVRGFIVLSGDDNPLHRDKKFAKNKGFARPLAHGMLLAAYFSKLVGKHFLKNHNLYLSQNINFKKPVYIGEIITVKGRVKNKIDSVKMLEIETMIINQKNQMAVSGLAQVKYI